MPQFSPEPGDSQGVGTGTAIPWPGAAPPEFAPFPQYKLRLMKTRIVLKSFEALSQISLGAVPKVARSARADFKPAPPAPGQQQSREAHDNPVFWIGFPAMWTGPINSALNDL